MKKYPEEIKTEARRLRQEDRLSVRQVARKLNIALSTASSWLEGLVLTSEELIERAYAAGEKGAKAIKKRATRYTSNCVVCEKLFEHVKRNKMYCSARCKINASIESRKKRGQKVSSWRQRTKLRAIEYKGGSCIVCGYSRCVSALEFHHSDPSQKDFSITADGITRSWERIQAELDKCLLLCSNCHREHHAGFLDLSTFHGGR